MADLSGMNGNFNLPGTIGDSGTLPFGAYRNPADNMLFGNMIVTQAGQQMMHDEAMAQPGQHTGQGRRRPTASWMGEPSLPPVWPQNAQVPGGSNAWTAGSGGQLGNNVPARNARPQYLPNQHTQWSFDAAPPSYAQATQAPNQAGVPMPISPPGSAAIAANNPPDPGERWRSQSPDEFVAFTRPEALERAPMRNAQDWEDAYAKTAKIYSGLHATLEHLESAILLDTKRVLKTEPYLDNAAAMNKAIYRALAETHWSPRLRDTVIQIRHEYLGE